MHQVIQIRIPVATPGQPGPHALASLRAPGKNPGSHQHGRMFRILFLTRKQHLPTTICWANPDLARVPSLGQGIIVDSLRDMPIPSKTNTQNARQSYFQHPMHVLQVFWGLHGFVSGPHALHGTAGLRGGHARCVGLTHTSALCQGGHALHWHGPH